tara:strand:- start:787 stop:1116 length:330 start_codon:yes stop_codon:yes gene_type:complete
MDYILDLPKKDVELYLKHITRQKNHEFRKKEEKKMVLLYKGQVLTNQFRLNINRRHQLITLNGMIAPAKSNSTKLELKGKLVWPNFLIKALLFLGVTTVLFFLSVLLFQ